MWKFVVLLSLLGTGALALPAELLQKLLNQLEDKGTSDRNIYTFDVTANKIAVALQKDTSWKAGFTMSLFYLEDGVADKPATAVFEDKTWAQCASYSVDWGTLSGSNRAVSIEGLSAGTTYKVYTVVSDGSGRNLGQTREITTSGSKSLEKKLEELLKKLEQDKEMSTRNINAADSDSDSIAVAFQADRSWPTGFTVSLYYKVSGTADSEGSAAFEDKPWSELENSGVDWGKLNGYKYSWSIDGLTPDTAYDVKSVVKSGIEELASQERTISTKANKTLDKKALLKALKDLI